MSITRPYLPWNLRNYFLLLVNDKTTASFQIYMSNICLPSIISNFTNNKNELLKPCQANKLSKPLFNRFNRLQVCPSKPPFVFAVFIYTSF